MEAAVERRARRRQRGPSARIRARLSRPHPDRRAGAGFRRREPDRPSDADVLRPLHAIRDRGRRRGGRRGGAGARYGRRKRLRRHSRIRHRRRAHDRRWPVQSLRQGREARAAVDPQAYRQRRTFDALDPLRRPRTGLRGRQRLLLRQSGDWDGHAYGPLRHGRARHRRRRRGEPLDRHPDDLGNAARSDPRQMPPLLQGPQRHEHRRRRGHVRTRDRRGRQGARRQDSGPA